MSDDSDDDVRAVLIEFFMRVRNTNNKTKEKGKIKIIRYNIGTSGAPIKEHKPGITNPNPQKKKNEYKIHT